MTEQPDTALCTEAEIRQFVAEFYKRIRQDEKLGPIFERHVKDWPTHLVLLQNFWSALLLGTRRFQGAPIPAHARLPDLSWPLFERWLQLFYQTTSDVSSPALKTRADATATRIAAKLWEVYQRRAMQSVGASVLPENAQYYASSLCFTEENLPAALSTMHTTRSGKWGVLRVQSGMVRFMLDAEPYTQTVLASGEHIVIEPEVPHHVSFELPGQFQIDFYRVVPSQAD